MTLELPSTFTLSYVDENGETRTLVNNIINFKRNRADEVEERVKNFQQDESDIIVLNNSCSIKPEPLELHYDLEYEDQDTFDADENELNFVDEDGNSYILDHQENTEEECQRDFITLDDLEEGEIRGARYDSEQGVITYRKGTTFDCPVCFKVFSQKGNLLRHIQIHSGDKPFICNLCGHKFTQKSNLQKHFATHLGDKKFTCGVCDKSFVQKANLIRHLRIHTGEKPFACELCGHRFTQKGNLKKHMQLHTSDMEINCEKCNCKFPTFTAKQKHEAIVHDEFSYEQEDDSMNSNQCVECPAKFRTKRALLKHLKFHD